MMDQMEKSGDGILIQKMGMSQKRRIRGVCKTVLLFILACIWLIPILWLLVTAFSAYPGMSRTRFFPERWTLDNFTRLFFRPDSILQYGRWFMNTLIIALFTCIVSSIFVLMVSYALSCMRFPGRQGIIRFSMILGMFPGALSMVAVYFINLFFYFRINIIILYFLTIFFWNAGMYRRPPTLYCNESLPITNNS